MAAFVLYNKLMLITVGVCRLPRLLMVLIISLFFSKFEGKDRKKWYWYENLVRLVTTCLMPVLAFIFQLVYMIGEFCPRHPSPANEEKCNVNYGATMGSIILVYTCVDVWLQLMHKRWVEWYQKTGGVSTRAQQYEVDLGAPIELPSRETMGIPNVAAQQYQEQVEQPEVVQAAADPYYQEQY
jgi:hypothetical protein